MPTSFTPCTYCPHNTLEGEKKEQQTEPSMANKEYGDNSVWPSGSFRRRSSPPGTANLPLDRQPTEPNMVNNDHRDDSAQSHRVSRRSHQGVVKFSRSSSFDVSGRQGVTMDHHMHFVSDAWPQDFQRWQLHHKLVRTLHDRCSLKAFCYSAGPLSITPTLTASNDFRTWDIAETLQPPI
jgi:hypothetical protein